MSWTVEWMSARDGVRLRVGRWPVPGSAGVCLLLQGRGDFLEKHEDAAGRLAGLGLHVVSVDWRGQGRSQRLGAAPGVSDVARFDDYLDDLDGLVSSVAAVPGPRVLLAHSMGSLVAMHHLLRHPDAVAKAVLISPMWAFAGRTPPAVVRALAGAAALVGRSTAPAWGERPAAPERCDLDSNMATADPGGFAELQALQIAHRDAVVAGSTWRWAGAAVAAMEALRRADLSAVGTDVLVASAPEDPSVDPAEHHRVAARLRRARVVEYPGRHDLLFEGRATRERLWSDVARHLGTSRVEAGEGGS